MTPAQQEALVALEKYGNKQAAADALGISRSSFRGRYNAAQRFLAAPEGQKAALEASGLDMASAKHGWRVVQHKDGSRDSVFWKAEDESGQQFIDLVKDAFTDLTPREPITAPRQSDNGLCTFYNIVDHHLAMHSWGLETGEDYDLEIGITRLRDTMGLLVESSPKSEMAVVLNMGDFFHADDQRNQTPQNKHALDVDGRYFKVIQAGVALTVSCIDMVATRHSKVVYRALRGNHDMHAHVALTIALSHHYRNCDHVEIQADPSDFFVFEWGRNMVCAHHGDKAKADRLVLNMADRWPEIWGRTHWRYMWTGHIHHDSAKDIGGVKWESFRTLAPKDAFAASGAYSARQTMTAITMDKMQGEIQRNVCNIIPPRFR